MTVSIVNAAAAAAWAAATSQTNQMNDLASALGSNWVARIEGSGGTLRRTQTYAALTVSGTTPRSIVIGAPLTDTANSTGDITRVVFRTSGGVDILTADAQSGSGPASIDFAAGGIKTACMPTLAGVTLTASAGLPVAGELTWLGGAAVNEWRQIGGTTSPGELKDFCGVALREEENLVELFSGATGGHGGNLTNNRVMTLRLDVNAPAWVERRAASDATGWDTTGLSGATLPDGRPAPRHTYTQTAWVPEIGRYYVRGTFWGSDAVNSPPDTATFNPATNDWDIPSPYADFNASVFYGWRNPATGIWYSGQERQWNPATDVHAAWPTSGTGVLTRQGQAFAPSRGYAFQVVLGDNFDAGSGRTVNAAIINTPSGVRSAITFNASAAYTDFQNNAPNIHGTVVYNPDLDVFYYYGGNSGQTAKVYVITPNAGTVWDMSLLSVTGLTPPVCLNGCNDKIKYISRWKTLVLIPDGANIHFLKVQ